VRCDRLATLARPLPPFPDPEALRARLEATGARFDAIGPPPAALTEAAPTLGALLARRKLPADGVVMVGARPDERDWAEAARLARFLGAEAFFEA
jgi:hypothetical protein